MEPLVEFAVGVRYVIRRTFTILLPGVSRTSRIFGTDEEFRAHVTARFAELDPSGTSEAQCRRAVCEVACNEISEFCGLIRGACSWLGFEKIADRYLDTARILKIMLGQDRAKLAALTEIVDSGDADFGRLMMRMSEVLDGRQNVYENFDPAAKTKATEDVKNISRCAETMSAWNVKTPEKQIPCQEVRQLECQAEVVGKIEEVGGKVDAAKDEIKDEIRELTRRVHDLAQRRGRGGRRRHSDACRNLCSSCWSAAKRDPGLRDSLNTRLTYEAAYTRYRNELEAVGVDTVGKFRRIIHSAQSLESAHRRKRLDEQRDGRWVLV